VLGRVTVALAAIAGLVGVGLLFASLTLPDDPPPVRSHQHHRADAPVARHGPAGVPRRGLPDRTTGRLMPESRPVRLTIPRLHLSTGLERLGLDSAGAIQVPRDPAVPGWYTLGPTPGALGPAVVAGHVTWNRAPAVFFRLSTLRSGDVVSVRRADGRTAVFTVRKVARFAKTHFPTRRVFGATHRAALRLVTCGGTYDGRAHRYLDNVVVFADLSGAT
jgi:hypothetical protein